MILVFLLFSLLLLISLVFFILLFSNLKIQINKLHISNISGKLKITFISGLSIFIFNKFKILELKIDYKKFRNLFENKKIDIKKIKDVNILEVIKNQEIYIEKLTIEGYLGLENAAYTAYVLSCINAIISIFLSKEGYKYNSRKYKHIITPIYTNQNLVNIEINCIISIKMVHIINILFNLLKKGRVKKYERTSYRRSYAYGHE